MYPFRVFLSYSHEDRPVVAEIAAVLENEGLRPVWDKDIRPGFAFTDAIKSFILHAHIFMPILTQRARKRPWVHQETGYAMALNVPILPLAIGPMPGEMLAQLQAIQVREDLADLPAQLGACNLERLVLHPLAKPLPILIEVADGAEERTALTVEYANRVVNELGQAGRVRQRAQISLFNVPDAPENDPVWKTHDGTVPRTDYFHRILREQRRIMEQMARVAGCSLIIDPALHFEEVDPKALRVRLTVFQDFLKSMPDDLVQVVWSPEARYEVVTIVGDWFFSESRVRSAGQGWRHSIFSWHAPTVLRKALAFDELLKAELAKKGIAAQESRQAAIEEIESFLKPLA
jgi:hypothetical protein